MMKDEALITETRNEVHDAVQKYMSALYGPGVVTNWVVTAEGVNDSDEHLLYLGLSENITSWGLRGLSYVSAKVIHELTS